VNLSRSGEYAGLVQAGSLALANNREHCRGRRAFQTGSSTLKAISFMIFD
jgi:hypothetical protein